LRQRDNTSFAVVVVFVIIVMSRGPGNTIAC